MTNDFLKKSKIKGTSNLYAVAMGLFGVLFLLATLSQALD